MKYNDGYELNNNGKVKECPQCGNEDVDYGEYCIICGAYLINKCMGTHKSNDKALLISNCNTIAEGNARYCYKCGERTTFFKYGYLKEWGKYNDLSPKISNKQE